MLRKIIISTYGLCAAAERFDGPRNGCSLKANLFSTYSPEFIAWRSYTPPSVIPALYVAECEASSGHNAVSVKLAIEKSGKLLKSCFKRRSLNVLSANSH
jgi:hypothetical protein